MNNLNIAPHLKNYHLDENGRIMLTNFNHTSDDHQFGFGASTQQNFNPAANVAPINQDQSLNRDHKNHSTDPQSQISSPGGARGRGCGRSGGLGRGRGSKKNSLQGGRRNITFAEQLDEGQTARVDHSSQPNQTTQSSQLNPTTQSFQMASGRQAKARVDLNNCISQGSADAVWQVSFANGKGQRLTNRIEDELKHFTLEYQKKIHKLAITYKLQSKILFKWVGGFNKMKGPNRFNNYCRYGRKPCEIFSSRTVNPEEKKRIAKRLVKVQKASKSGAKALKVCKKWVNWVAEDFNHMREDHQVEGFFNLVSSDSLGSVFLSGGTPLGEEYMDMLKAKYECWKKFRIWVTGMTVDGELNPLGQPIKKLPKHVTNSAQAKPWEAGEVPDKKKIMREHLRIMLFLKIKPEAVEPSTGVDLWKTLLDGNPSAYSKDQIHAVLKALHFKWILLNKKDPATATGTDSRGSQGTGSKQQEARSTAEGNMVGGEGNKANKVGDKGAKGKKVGGKGNKAGREGNEVSGKGNKVGANE
ncbi:hypothetical protein PCASD_08124 [Puccinia coronata f. sp. avenae]|uniref:Uncharacterized protein n=1 Tax=Puccinia coronata f. sp. avenae TaxID=200324 RepID=A0A2N5VAD9_9BASI|nr:hypothetical protein PCASD_08124 [Puccinia coronata f. sp. avenae]